MSDFFNNKYKVAEKFVSINGEGKRAGQLAVFVRFAGCNLKCRYCDTMWANEPDVSFDIMTDEQILSYILDTKVKNVTLTGGEPLLQIDFLIELFRKAKEMGIHTTLDTSGNPYTEKEPFYSKWLELMKYTDLILLDIKHIDEQEHIKLTGQTNKNILAMAEKLSDMGKPVWIRHVLVPERSDRDDYLHRLADFIHTLKNVERVEVLPYHTLGVFKWENLGIPYQLEGINPPSAERIKNAEEILAFRK